MIGDNLFNTIWDMLIYILIITVYGVIGYFIIWFIIDSRKTEKQLRELMTLYKKVYEERLMMQKRVYEIVGLLINSNKCNEECRKLIKALLSN